MPLSYDSQEAIRRLTRSDRRLGRIIAAIGNFGLELYPAGSPFEALTRSIVYQQLSGHAAGAIHRRLLEWFPESRHPSPEQMLTLSDEELRGIGLSRAKTAALRDLAAKTRDQALPSSEALEHMSDDAVIETLATVRGVGQWTAQMLLIFHLGRPDVLPATDLGIRKGFQYTYRRKELPRPGEILDFGERWRPYRSVASWYLWRASYL